MRTTRCCLLAFLLGCGSTTEQMQEVKPATFDAATVAQAVIDQYDTTKDGTLDASEAAASPGLKPIFASLDTDRSQTVRAEELAARFSRYQIATSGVVPVAVQVTLDGKPLELAKVRFEPEAAFAKVLKPAEALTDAQGRCSEFSVDGQRQAGLAAGLYLIRIEKDGTPLLPKYNAQTALGREVITDGRAGEVTIVLPLSSR